eukprot:CAMPEP_0197571392 /NCGR_PEP_ID=MMETSP1320-20131121/41934_1 /TAXON_ID=91990 /ORGANISM="Bolidomonas sp., Strain RCC2347" /LENGTH=506 /DNA_ID=CAMNT_0043133885 /DNA_START=33 /DNA_END=1553 /DNA_ORIENTATION=+
MARHMITSALTLALASFANGFGGLMMDLGDGTIDFAKFDVPCVDHCLDQHKALGKAGGPPASSCPYLQTFKECLSNYCIGNELYKGDDLSQAFTQLEEQIQQACYPTRKCVFDACLCDAPEYTCFVSEQHPNLPYSPYSSCRNVYYSEYTYGNSHDDEYSAAFFDKCPDASSALINPYSSGGWYSTNWEGETRCLAYSAYKDCLVGEEAMSCFDEWAHVDDLSLNWPQHIPEDWAAAYPNDQYQFYWFLQNNGYIDDNNSTIQYVKRETERTCNMVDCSTEWPEKCVDLLPADATSPDPTSCPYNQVFRDCAQNYCNSGTGNFTQLEEQIQQACYPTRKCVFDACLCDAPEYTCFVSEQHPNLPYSPYSSCRNVYYSEYTYGNSHDDEYSAAFFDKCPDASSALINPYSSGGWYSTNWEGETRCLAYSAYKDCLVGEEAMSCFDEWAHVDDLSLNWPQHIPEDWAAAYPNDQYQFYWFLQNNGYIDNNNSTIQYVKRETERYCMFF